MRKLSRSARFSTSDFPPAFLQQMSDLLGNEYIEFFKSLQQPALVGLRVNTLKVAIDHFQRISPYKLAPVPWCESGFSVENGNGLYSPGKHPYHEAGLYYLQEPSAMAAAEVLNPQPGERVLDLAAAPGGKSTHLASLMNNTGILVVNEIHPKRVWDLAENLERCGVTNAIVTNDSPERLANHFGEYFDLVLLDAPCSGEGMFRKNQAARNEWSIELSHSCVIRQSMIMEHASKLIKPGGYLAYTTCTFSPEENEGVVAKFLDEHPEFDLFPVVEMRGFTSSKPGWVGLPQDHQVAQARRIWPHLANGEGHFIALFTKTRPSLQGNILKTTQESSKLRKIIRREKQPAPLKLLNDFCHENLNIAFDGQQIAIEGSYIYQIPKDSPRLDSLRVIHPGWWIGSIQKDRFIPSHALALGIHSSNTLQTLSLHAEGDRVIKYLHGETMNEPGADGWILITVEGFPLGWGKRVHGIIKNYYPRGLRNITW